MNNIKFGFQKNFTQQFLPQYYLRKKIFSKTGEKCLFPNKVLT